MATRRIVLRRLGTAVGIGAVPSAVEKSIVDSVSTRTIRRQAAQRFNFQQKLFPDEGDARDMFGSSIAVSEGTAIIGAPGDEGPNGNESGSIYVFEQRNSEWSEQRRLAPEAVTEDDRFGSAIALSGDTLVGGTEDAGAYVFERSGGGWNERQQLTTDDGEDDGGFGSAVAVAGETIVVGAPFDQNRNGDEVGSAYVFTQRNGEWSQQQQLIPDDGDDADRFGDAVAINSDTIVSTARSDWDPNGDDAGSAYVFERRDGEWNQRQKLASDDGDQYDQFGGAVSLSGDTAVIGTPSDDEPNGNGAGSAYVFGRTSGEWTQQQKLAANDGDERDQFGSAVSLHNDMVAIGAITDEDPNGSDSGSVYVFQREGTTWSQQQKIAPSGADARDRAGIPALTSGDLLIGAPRDEDPNGNNAGSTYAFARETEDETTVTTTPASPETTTSMATIETTETSSTPQTTTPTTEPTTAEPSTTSSASTTTIPTESTTTTAPTATESPETTTTTGQSGFGLIAVGVAIVLGLKRFTNQK